MTFSLLAKCGARALMGMLLLGAPSFAAIPRASATSGAGEIVLTWEQPAIGDVLYYLVYRGEGRDPDTGGEPFEMVKGLRFVDTQVTPGLHYHYSVVPVDRSGARGAPTSVAESKAAGGSGPRLAAVAVEPSGRVLRPGDVLTVTASGQSGAQASAELKDLAAQIRLKEMGKTGRYVGTYTVRAADLGAKRKAARVVAHLYDASGASELAGPQVELSARNALQDKAPPVIARASHDGWRVAGFSGKLVAGDVLTVTAEGEPGAVGTFELPGVAGATAMRETRPGTYVGTYTVRWADRLPEAAVVVSLTDEAGNEARVQAGRAVGFDTRVRLEVVPSEAVLAADGRSQTRVVVRAGNANGDEVSGHPVGVGLVRSGELATAGGALSDGRGGARGPAESRVSVPRGAATDAFGEVAATFTAGQGAGRILILAEDLSTGDVGVGWVETEARPGEPELRVARQTRDRAARATAGNSTRPRLDGARLAAEPSESELRRAYGAVFVTGASEGQSGDRIKVAEWLVRPGDKVEKAQAVVVLESRTGRKTLIAPAKGILLKSVKKTGERVDVGDVVGYVEIDNDVWTREYARKR